MNSFHLVLQHLPEEGQSLPKIISIREGAKQLRPLFSEDPLFATEIAHILREARSFLRAQHNPQWDTGGPTLQSLQREAEQHRLYGLFKANLLQGICCLVPSPDPWYAGSEEYWTTTEPYFSIHRVMRAHPGFFDALCTLLLRTPFAWRVDTHRCNLPMQRALLRNGFNHCGAFIASDGLERLLYDSKPPKESVPPTWIS